MHACGVNHLDCQLRSGALQKEHELAFPAVLHTDVSGVVRKIGSKVLNVKVGDSVFGRQKLQRVLQGRGGACAEWCVVEALDVVAKPGNITHEQAAAVPSAALVAFAALRSGDLPEADEGDGDGKGPKVAILGASGGVGTFAVQMAKKHFGAYVLACCSGKHKALVQKLGADRVVDYTQEAWKEECREFKNFDLVLDCVGLDAYWETFGRSVLGSHGRYITLNTLQAELPQCAEEAEGKGTKKSAGKKQQPKAAEDASLFDKELERQATERLLAAKSRMLNINSYFSGFRLFAADKDVQDDELETVADLIQDGAVQVVVDSVHELRDVDKAHQLVEGMHTAGKVVVRLRRPWERESVQNFRLATDEAQERPQEAPSPGSPSPSSPSAKVPLCSLGPEAVDKESITKKLTAGKSPRRARGGLGSYPGIAESDADGEPLVPGLPAGWEFAYDEEGTIYYYSHALGISQYEHPATGKLEPAAATDAHAAAAEAAVMPIHAATEAQKLAARGSRSSGFMDDLSSVPPQPASFGLPQAVGDLSDDDDAHVRRWGRGVLCVVCWGSLGGGGVYIRMCALTIECVLLLWNVVCVGFAGWREGAGCVCVCSL